MWKHGSLSGWLGIVLVATSALSQEVALGVDAAGTPAESNRLREPSCEAYNPELASSLADEILTRKAELESLDEEAFNSPLGKERKATYADLLTRFELTQTSLPDRCRSYVAHDRVPLRRFVTVDVAYLTDRAPAVVNNRQGFANHPTPHGTHVGRVEVYLGGGGRCGTRFGSRPGIGFEEIPTFRRETFLDDAKSLTLDQWLKGLSDYQRLYPQSTIRDAARTLIFVHGYNVSFEDAAITAAELANCLDAPIVPVLVSWASMNRVVGYGADEERVEISRMRFKEILTRVLTHPDLPPASWVAHSMGARLSLRILMDMATSQSARVNLERVAFAAADIHEAELLERFPQVRALAANGWALYVANNDSALWGSTLVHGASRVGDSSRRVFVQAGTDTIEVSKANRRSVDDSLAHSYLVKNPHVVDDLRILLVHGKPADDRGLTRNPKPVFWMMEPQ